MNYKQITNSERAVIANLRGRRYSCRKIGEILSRHHSTIAREVKRNAKPYDNGYRVLYACQNSNARKVRSRKKSQFSKYQWKFIEGFLRLEWSPEQISRTLKKHDILGISHETTYRNIHRDRKKGGDLYKSLRQSNKKRRKKYLSRDSGGILRGKRPLEDRPEEANDRSISGHFEVDLVHGKTDKDCILTLVDRKTRFLIIRKLNNKSMNEVKKYLVRLVRRYNISTITADNGTEWHAFKKVEKLTGVKFYFAKPYHSWERGTNENTNGLIRQYIPKGVSMKSFDQCYCNRIMKRINRRPKKVLDWNCPESAFLGFDFVALLS